MGFFNWAAPVFDRFADRWSPSHIDQISAWLKPYVPDGGSLLDVGGGTGALAVKLHESLNCEVTVLDPTPEMLRYIPDTEPVHAVVGAAESMPFDRDSFDAIVVTDAFHHFAAQDAAAREMRRVVRCGGGVLVLDIDPSGWMRALVWGEKLLGEPGAFMKPAEMCAFMSRHGIDGECERTAGTGYRFLGVVQR
jgi:demethylmenaquinone methyltransferase/2-methoxy-6-polyprenyl-1,4-benzoquinol methylase